MRERKIYDSVHGFIRFGDLERMVIDSPPFQRLHSIHQLGIAYLVYPGATHTRFEHSLGVMELATRLYDKIVAKAEELELPQEDFGYWRQLLRLAALLHDLGHLPFSHTAEKWLLGPHGHEYWTWKIVSSPHLGDLLACLEQLYPSRPILTDLLKLTLGHHLQEIAQDPSLTFTLWERVVSSIITADFFGADRIDYLLRDAQCTGVSYGLFDYHQLIEMATPVIEVREGVPSLELGMEENGIEACEALLLARHFMYRRVYQYPSVRSYSFHLARFMHGQAQREGWLTSVDHYLAVTDDEVRAAIRAAARNPSDPGHLDALCLLERGARFKAIELPPETTLEQLLAIQQRLGLTSTHMDWELAPEKLRTLQLSFPVLTRSGAVVSASSLSTITLPHGPPSWVYIAPLHRASLEEALV